MKSSIQHGAGLKKVQRIGTGRRNVHGICPPARGVKRKKPRRPREVKHVKPKLSDASREREYKREKDGSLKKQRTARDRGSGRKSNTASLRFRKRVKVGQKESQRR